jgi:hypothetical protein
VVLALLFVFTFAIAFLTEPGGLVAGFLHASLALVVQYTAWSPHSHPAQVVHEIAQTTDNSDKTLYHGTDATHDFVDYVRLLLRGGYARNSVTQG